MNEDQRQVLITALSDSYALKGRFSDFELDTKRALLQSQLQFFQSLGGICLALLAIGLGTNNLDKNVWTIGAIIFSLLLLIYTSTYSREIIDLQDEELGKAKKFVEMEQKQIEDKIVEALDKNDNAVWENYARSKISLMKDKKETLLVTGEIALFLFFNAIFWGFLSVADINFNCFILVGILVLSYFIVFKNWVIKLTKFLSRTI